MYNGIYGFCLNIIVRTVTVPMREKIISFFLIWQECNCQICKKLTQLLTKCNVNTPGSNFLIEIPEKVQPLCIYVPVKKF